MRQSDLEARAGADSVARAIGGRVRQGRNGRGWTLDQLAERSGVSRRMLVSIEQGSANPSIATLLLISDALGIGLPALVDMGRSARAAGHPGRYCPGAVAGRARRTGRARRRHRAAGRHRAVGLDARAGREPLQPRRTRREPASCSSSLTASSSSGWASTPRYSPRETRRRSPVTCPTGTSTPARRWRVSP